MTTPQEIALPFAEVLQTIEGALAGSDPAWLRQMREAGYARYAELGLPTPRLERWKYTPLRSLEDTEFRVVTEADGRASIDKVPSLFASGHDGPRLVFVNGQPRPDLSRTEGLPDGVTLEPLIQAMERDADWVEAHLGRITAEDDGAMVALNTAGMNSGFVLRVGRGVVVEAPIEVVFAAGLTDRPVACFPRNLVVLEPGAEATLVVNHTGVGVGPYLANGVTEIAVGEGARLRSYGLQDETLDATHISSVRVRVDKDGRYDGFGLALGGRLSRNELVVGLVGPGAEAKLDGLYLMRGREHCDNTTLVEHRVPDTRCDEMYKGVLDDESRAVFQGKIVVERDAQRSDGQMVNKTLLLADGAEIDTKPELEIYADDVKCSHGAASGQIDEQALFYLRTRGIPEAQARNLLVQSFLGEVVERIASEPVREAVAERIVHWLPGACFRQAEWRDG